MSKIGIIFAMKEEIDSFLKYIKVENEFKIFELTFIKGMLNNNECFLVESGVGKVNSARSAQILIDNFKVDYVLNVGVAAGLTNDLNIKDLVIGDKLYQHDFDITAFDHNKGYVPKIGDYLLPDEYLLNISKKINFDGEVYGPIASGDIFLTSPDMASKINKKFGAIACEMEGAAIAQVCYLSYTPFLIIKSISDKPGNDNKITYEEFLLSSSENVANYLNEFIKNI